jgi:2-keto-4-pentenoate hydratase/2-oxohepta-3-ene-1,7-dioic acid hydratase in catechol pathway
MVAVAWKSCPCRTSRGRPPKGPGAIFDREQSRTPKSRIGPDARCSIALPVKFVTYDRRGSRRLGAVVEGTVIDLPDAVGHPAFPTSMESMVAHSRGTVLEAAAEALAAPDAGRFSVPSARLLAPIEPGSLLHFPGYGGGHWPDLGAARVRRRPARGAGPAYYRLNPRTVLGPAAEVAWPTFAQELDVEAALACVVGRAGRDLAVREAGRRIFGFAVLGDWTARDEERREREAGAGPGRSRDFATSLGPWIATPDEVGDPLAIEIRIRVNGEAWAEGPLTGTTWKPAELMAFASAGQEVRPGDVVATGALSGGCGTEMGRCLEPGGRVEIDGGPLGVLPGRVGRRPNPRHR